MLLTGRFNGVERNTFMVLGGLMVGSIACAILTLAVMHTYFALTNQTTLEFGYIKSQNVFNVGKR